MTVHIAMPSHRRGQKLWPSFDEDDLTLAWEVVQKAGLPAGTAVAAVGIDLPAWWWTGTGLVSKPEAEWNLRPIPTSLGPSVVLHKAGPVPDVEAAARALYDKSPQRSEVEWQKHRVARDAPDTESDFPLGAYVTPGRHDEVLAGRLRLGIGKVATWTAIGPGVAPTEFSRLQDAVGPYYVILVEGVSAVTGGAGEATSARTVGIWCGAEAPRVGQPVRVVLRRLYRMQGTWRHGAKFLPA